MEILKQYALSFVGTPYLWAGSNPIAGLDCSGLVQEILASAGVDPPGDQSAQGLFDALSAGSEWNRFGCGAVVFYGKSAKEVTHVGFMVDNFRIVEAGGGGSSVVDLQSAIAKNAFVRVRHYKYRNDLVAILKPRYSSIGLF